VVLAAGEYPAGTARGSEINGIEAASASGALVFHAGTALRDGQVTTNGGRVLNVVGRGATLASARDSAYGAAALISFPGVRYRNDIGELAAAGFTVSTSG
jgi:phosphoribosylamine--glycine ligase